MIWFTIEEISNITGYSQSHVYNLVKKVLPGRKSLRKLTFLEVLAISVFGGNKNREVKKLIECFLELEKDEVSKLQKDLQALDPEKRDDEVEFEFDDDVFFMGPLESKTIKVKVTNRGKATPTLIYDEEERS